MRFKRHLFMLTVFMIWVFPVIAMGPVTKIPATAAELALYKANGYNSPRKDVPGERRYKKYYGPWSSKQVKQWFSSF